MKMPKPSNRWEDGTAITGWWNYNEKQFEQFLFDYAAQEEWPGLIEKNKQWYRDVWKRRHNEKRRLD